MIAEIISIGSELLRGELTDTNSSWLSAQLLSSGIEVRAITQVGDNQERLADTLRCSWNRSNLTITTGGLGPTADDLTRESIAEMFGETLSVDPHLESALRNLFAQFGRPMPEHNLKQAMLIPSAWPLDNPLGTAPGWWIERDGKMLAVLPGPPREMQHMWTAEVMTRLTGKTGGGTICCRTLKILGLSEAGIDEIISKAATPSPVEIGIYAKSDGIHLKLIARSDSRESAERSIMEAESVLRGIFGHHLWGVDDDTLVGTIGRHLLRKGQTVATMEAFTGGLLASSLGSVPDSSQYYRGGIVLGSPYLHGGTFSLPAGGCSPVPLPADAAATMADSARHHLQAAIGIGIAGPHGDAAHRNAVAIVVADGNKKRTRESAWPLTRHEVRQWIALAALMELKLFLEDL